MEDKELVKIAYKAMEKAYAPYSGFSVGAAVLTDDGKVYTGVNIENATYGATCCAERTAVYKAVSEGSIKIRTVAIASCGDDYVFPCGICRQVLSEFGNEHVRVICSKTDEDFKTYTLGELLPEAFKKIPVKKGGCR